MRRLAAINASGVTPKLSCVSLLLRSPFFLIVVVLRSAVPRVKQRLSPRSRQSARGGVQGNVGVPSWGDKRTLRRLCLGSNRNCPRLGILRFSLRLRWGSHSAESGGSCTPDKPIHRESAVPVCGDASRARRLSSSLHAAICRKVYGSAAARAQRGMPAY